MVLGQDKFNYSLDRGHVQGGTSGYSLGSVDIKTNALFQYRVTIQVVSNLTLTSIQKLCYSMRPMYENAHFVLMSTGGLTQPEWSPCTESKLKLSFNSYVRKTLRATRRITL